MNSTLKGVLIFVLGAAAGSLATWKLIEKKYKDIAQEEIDSVKDTFSKMKKNEYPDKLEDYPDFEEFDDSDDVEEEPKPEQKIDRNNKPDIVEYAKILSETGYTNYAERQDKKEKKGLSLLFILPFFLFLPIPFSDIIIQINRYTNIAIVINSKTKNWHFIVPINETIGITFHIATCIGSAK